MSSRPSRWAGFQSYGIQIITVAMLFAAFFQPSAASYAEEPAAKASPKDSLDAIGVAEEVVEAKADLAPADTVPIYELAQIDLDPVRSEDLLRAAEGLPPRFAIPHEVQISPLTDGLWETAPDGSLVWRLRIVARGARSINLGFTSYFMPEGGRLLLYAADHSYAIRPFTTEDNMDHGELWTPVIPSGDIMIEVTVPGQFEADLLSLDLTSINYGYRGFGEPTIPPGEPEDGSPRSGACNRDVVCPEGVPWQNEIRSVAVISTGGSLFCTGFMVNNTAQNQVPYFMTANHCGITSGNAASLVTYWNYQTTVCSGTPNGVLNQFNTGSTFRAGSSASDFTLVQLSANPNPAYGVTFAGWDRSNAATSSAVCIHHPSTDEKRISFENDPTQITSYLGSSVPGDSTHIRVVDWDIGTTEGGSSGSPLFSPGHRVVGQLHGGFAACGNDSSDWYGRFFVSWTGGGTNSTRLSNWLDPGNTGATTLNTLVPGGSVCGNNIIEPGEQCDDGNTISGDGCSSTCQNEVVLPGEQCSNCTPVGNGTVNATTAGYAGTTDITSCTTGDVIDRWYCYTASCTGTATASLCGSSYDTALAVFSSCGGTQLACNDDNESACGTGSLQSQVTWSVVSGTVYYVRISGFQNATGSYTLNLSCAAPAGCPNDTVANPKVIPGLPYNDTGSTATCADNYNEVCPFTVTGGRDMVYSYVAPYNETIAINMCASSYDTKVYIYQNSVTPGTTVACNDDGCPGSPPASYRSNLTGVNLIGGQTYYIVVDGYDAASSGNYSIAITTSGPPAGPANDLCANATPVSEGVFPFNTTGAGTDGPDEPANCTEFSYSNIGADVWFRYTASCTGTAVASLCGSGYDTKMAVYSGGVCPTSQSALVCNDDFCGSPVRQSQVTFNTTAGAIYLIRVGGFNALTGSGTLTLTCQECVGAVDCDDGNACTTDSCSNNSCVNTPIVCNDNNACTTDSCDPVTGCVFTPVVCNDNNPCTTDSCDSGTGCVFTPLPNQPPSASANGPYVLSVGSSVILSSAGSSDPNSACGDTITMYEWDLDNDGQFDDAFGASPSVSWAQMQTLGITTVGVAHTIQLRVTDSFSAIGTASSTITINCSTAPNGDVNADGFANGADLQGFVNAILSQSREAADVCPADFSGNSVVDMADVPGMVALLTAP